MNQFIIVKFRKNSTLKKNSRNLDRPYLLNPMEDIENIFMYLLISDNDVYNIFQGFYHHSSSPPSCWMLKYLI